ncbi:hypothetical protein BH20VER3_BH20VER3_08740 [soil metagenome]
MINSRMETETTTLTERGQVSIPSSIRRALGLKPGQELAWKKISEDEVRVRVVRPKGDGGAAAVVGCARQLHKERGWPTRTNAWLRTLRRGDVAEE